MSKTPAWFMERAPFTRIQPRCPYVGRCGGCTLQDLAYEDQLVLKRRRLEALMRPLDPTLEVTLQPLEDPWRYRNKAEFTFAQSESEHGVILGYHAARSFSRVIDLEDCLLLPESIMRLLRDVRRLASASGQPGYHPRTHEGFFRYLVVRSSRMTGQLLACLVTAPGDAGIMERLADQLIATHPELGGLYWGTTTRIADVATPDSLQLLRGQPALDEQIGPFRIRVHPQMFLQPTTLQAERMYAALTELIDPVPSGTAWDLYCGVGLIGFYLAPKFRQIHGIESDAGNIELAEHNAHANQISNISFHRGSVEDVLADKRFWLMEAKPDVVALDPPRSGLHPQAVAAVLAARPRQIAYLSCNPQSLARDVQRVLRGFPRYRLRVVRGFDAFPHTPHLEVLALLERA